VAERLADALGTADETAARTRLYERPGDGGTEVVDVGYGILSPEDLRSGLADVLPPDAYDRAHHGGTQMTYDEAITYLRSTLDLLDGVVADSAG
jgi:hypothetical protein